jgi:hypothetical protein
MAERYVFENFVNIYTYENAYSDERIEAPQKQRKDRADEM